MTPQALGALIKRTGITKSQSKKGNSYNYYTEGYTLTRQYGNRYSFSYCGRLQLARETESQIQSLNERKAEAFAKAEQALKDKGIRYTLDVHHIMIELEEGN